MPTAAPAEIHSLRYGTDKSTDDEYEQPEEHLSLLLNAKSASEIAAEAEEREKLIAFNQQSVLRKIYFYCCLSGFWIGFNIVYAACGAVMYPLQIGSTVGPASKDLYNGLVPAIGAIVSAIITPVAGALSDRSTIRSRFGRRRLYVLVGIIIALFFAIPEAIFPHQALQIMSPRAAIITFIVLSAGFQFGGNFASGAYTGLMPDLVPKAHQGTASGILGVSLSIGDLIGSLGTGFLLKYVTNPVYTIIVAYAFLLCTFLLFSWPTIFLLKEKPLVQVAPRLEDEEEEEEDEEEELEPKKQPFIAMLKAAFIKTIYLPPKLYRDFYFVFVARFSQEMGIYSILPFIQYYLADYVGVANAAFEASLLIAGVVVASIFFAVIGGILSDKFGRKPFVYLSSTVMAGTMLILVVLMALGVPHQPLPYWVVIVCFACFGCGYGMFQAVDWALALDVLPQGADVAKDMGLWNIAFVVPQVISPLISAVIVQTLKVKSARIAYITLLSTTAGYLVIATLLVIPIRKARKASVSLRDMLCAAGKKERTEEVD